MLCVKLPIAFFTVAFVAVSGLAEIAAASIWSGQTANDRNTLRFVEEVLFESEYEPRQPAIFKRWATAPKLSTFGPGSDHPNVIENVVKQLNQCLPESMNIQVLERNDASASLQVYFLPLKKFDEIAAAKSFEYVTGNWGFFHTQWNSKFEIESAVVLIADDKLSGSRLHHFVLEEITQCLGLPGDSKRFEKSVFYENQAENRFGKTTRLSNLDQQLIRFCYESVQPGQTPIEIGVAIANSKIRFSE